MQKIEQAVVDGKTLTLTQLKGVLDEARVKGKRIVLCHGVFDLMHPGHVLHLKAARQRGDLLVVTITPDRYARKAPGRPIFSQRLRMETIAALECVDFVALNEWPTAIETIRHLRPHVYAKGSDYADAKRDFTGNIIKEEAAVREVGGEIIFTQEESFSSSALINRFFQSHPPETEAFLRDFRKRYSAGEVIEYLEKLSDLRVVVMGEAILDQYTYCTPLSRPPKSTIVAAKFVSEENFLGGSLAVANHLAGFCKEVALVTCLGPEEELRKFIHLKLRPNVQLCTLQTPDRPTIVKRRFLDQYLTKIFEIQHLEDIPLPPLLEREMCSLFAKQFPNSDLVVVTDFGHGLLTEGIRETLYTCNKFLAINAQTNSANLGFNPVIKYRRADYVCVDTPELRLAAQSPYGEIPAMVDKVRQRLHVPNLMVSLGPEGTLFFAEDGAVYRTPIFPAKVIDRVGAGDALFAITSPCVYRDCPPDILGLIANCVGAIAIEIVCNREPIDPVTLKKFITYLLK